MSVRSFKEKEHHDRAYESRGGACWANIKAAGQIRQNQRAKMAQEHIKISDGMKILEIGCGNGEFSKRFLNNGAEMRCVDISAKLVAALQARYAGTNLKFETADVENLAYPEEYFDAVIGNGVLHHLDLGPCLRGIYSVLKKEGRIFFCEPNMLNPEVFLETNIRWIGKMARKTENETAFARKALIKKLQENGFRDIEVSPFDFLQPLTPAPLIGIVTKIGSVLEKIPFIKEIAGSLRITARK